MDAFSGAADMNGHVADEHGNGRYDFEIDERLDSQPADFFQVRMAGDAHHEDAEQQGRDNHLDEAKKNFAQHLHVFGKRFNVGRVREKMTVHRAGENAEKKGAESAIAALEMIKIIREI